MNLSSSDGVLLQLKVRREFSSEIDRQFFAQVNFDIFLSFLCFVQLSCIVVNTREQ